jgi:hypothetical protein
MYLEIAPAGGKWWRLKYRFAGKEKLLSLGVYPEVTLAEARTKRDDARKLLSRGIDPSAQRRVMKASAVTSATNTLKGHRRGVAGAISRAPGRHRIPGV